MEELSQTDLFSSTTVSSKGNIKLLMNLPVQIQLASPAISEWVTKRKESVRPWMTFVNTHNFRAPQSVPRWSKQVVKNVDYFQSNYMFIFIILILYCLITSPLLFFAVFLSLAVCYFLSLRNAEKQLVVGGHEVALGHQFTAVAIFSLPVFYVAGAGAVLFWVLGASLFVIGIHASFYNIESVLGVEEEPFSNPVEEV